jgi:hypothetical protein
LRYPSKENVAGSFSFFSLMLEGTGNRKTLAVDTYPSARPHLLLLAHLSYTCWFFGNRENFALWRQISTTIVTLPDD